MANQYITIIVDFDPFIKNTYKKTKIIKERLQNLTTVLSENGRYPLYIFLHYARISKIVEIDLKEPTLRNPRSDKMRGLIITLEYLGLRDDIPREKERLTWICSDLKEKLEMIDYKIIWGRDINF